MNNNKSNKNTNAELERFFDPKYLSFPGWNPDDEHWHKNPEKIIANDDENDPAIKLNAVRFRGRERILQEAHARSPQPLHGIARATRATWLFPSKEDTIRRLLRYSIERSHDEVQSAFLEKHKMAFCIYKDKTTQDTKVEDIINMLPPRPGVNGSLTEDEIVALIKALEAIESEVSLQWSYERYAKQAVEHITELLISCLKTGLSLDKFIEVYDPLLKGRISIEQNDHMNFKIEYEQPKSNLSKDKKRNWNHLKAKKLWFSFDEDRKITSEEITSDVKSQSRLKLLWEKFHLNQNFTIIEDYFTDTYDGKQIDRSKYSKYEPVLDYFTGGRIDQTDEELWKNDKATAIRRLEEEIKSRSENNGFSWFGRLFVCAHYWVIPAELLVTRLKKWPGIKRFALHKSIAAAQLELLTISNCQSPDEREKLVVQSQHLLRLLSYWAADVFGQGRSSSIARTPNVESSECRRDFVFSSITGGKALVLSDMLPGPEAIGSGTRTIIIDLGLDQEQRGRLLNRLMDIATFRILALRDLPIVEHVNYAVNQVGNQLSRHAAKLATLKNQGPADSDVYYEEIRDMLRHVNLLSGILGSLNLFLTNGISGAGISSDDYKNLFLFRANALREKRIQGYQTVEEFLVRIRDSVDSVTRLLNRYEIVRERLSQVTGAVQALMTKFQMDTIREESKKQSSIMDRQLLAIEKLELEAESQTLTMDKLNKYTLFVITLTIVIVIDALFNSDDKFAKAFGHFIGELLKLIKFIITQWSNIL